jgi:hypothetical protein
LGELTMLVAMGLLLYQWMRFDEGEATGADRRADAELEEAPSLEPREATSGN